MIELDPLQSTFWAKILVFNIPMVHYYFLVLTPEVLGAPSSSTGSARKTDPCLVCMTLEKLIVNGSICPIPGPKQVDISNIIRQEGVITVFRCVLKSLYEGVFVRRSVRTSVGPLVTAGK